MKPEKKGNHKGRLKEKHKWHQFLRFILPMSNPPKRNKIEAKDTKAILYQTACLLVVGSPSFWNAQNST